MSSTSKARGLPASLPPTGEPDDGKPRFVAGAIGPTNSPSSISSEMYRTRGLPPVSFDGSRKADCEHMQGPARTRC